MIPARHPGAPPLTAPTEPADAPVMTGLEAETFELDGLELVVFEVQLKPTYPEVLTAAEREIAHLICRGYTMAEIAESRHVRYRTVANQLASIYRKVGVHSSAELTAALVGTKR